MKTKILFIYAIFFTVALYGNARPIINSVPVTTNLIFSLVSGKTGFPSIQFNSNEMIYRSLIGTSTNYIKYLALPFNKTFDFHLVDDKNKEVPKAARGLANSEIPNLTNHINGSNKFKGQVVRRDIADMRILFRPDEMFVITNKGVYELDVRIRICVPMTNNAPDYKAMNLRQWLSNTHYGVVVSNPVRVRIIKE